MSVTATTLGGASSIFEAYGVTIDNNLTADALLIYIETQLGTLDRDINAYIQQQKWAIAQKDAISTVENAMKKHNPPRDEAAWGEIQAAFEQGIRALPPGDPIREELQAKFDALLQAYPPPDGIKAPEDHAKGVSLSNAFEDQAEKAASDVQSQSRRPSKEEWTSLLGDVQQLRENVGSNAELHMIQLQSLMSQRQTAVQLVTNIVSKFDQTLAGIVAKIGAV